jgi:hypothetical protein
VVLAMTPPRRRSRFEALALALEGWDQATDELIARCWAGAGDASRAAFHARRAADRASRALAFEHAARLYEQCLELSACAGGERNELLVCVGEALANAGHGALAAARYLEAAEFSAGAEALGLRLRASSELLQCGHVDEGIAALEPVLRAHGLELPRSTFEVARVVAGAAIARRIRHPRFRYRECAEAELPTELLQRLDLNWNVMLGLMDVSPEVAVTFQVRHLGLSLRLGESKRLALSLAAAGLRIGAFTHRLAATRPYTEVAERIVAERCDDVLAAEVAAFTKSCPFIVGNPGPGLEELIVAERRLKELGLEFRAGTKHATVVINSSLCLTGQLRRLRERVEPTLRDARQRGDLMLISFCGTGYASLSWLAADEPVTADELAVDIMGRWTRSGYFMQHFFCLVARTQAALYRGDALAAANLVVEHDEPHRRSRLVKMGINACFFLNLASRAASALQAAGGAAGHPILACEARIRRDVDRLCSPMARTSTLSMDAERLVLAKSEAAPAALTRAGDAFESAGMVLYAAACRYARGKLVGGDGGAAGVARSVELFVKEGVVAPERFIAMLLPSVEGLG